MPIRCPGFNRKLGGCKATSAVPQPTPLYAALSMCGRSHDRLCEQETGVCPSAGNPAG
jgi:hypothetical protein